MSTRYCCKNPNRAEELRHQLEDGRAPDKIINGIDYLEIASDDQKTLTVFFFYPLPGQTDGVPLGSTLELTNDHFVVDGGVRVTDIVVDTVVVSGNSVTLTVSDRGDFSMYTLRFVAEAGGHKPPPGFDPQLSEIEFSFKVLCPSDFDCKQEAVCPPEEPDEPEIDYLAKDYAGFRRLILDRMSVIMPDWRERHAADLQIALVEALAYVGDHLSYYQDAIAGEAYLGTARSRISVRRHARLLDYFMHDGCNARTWVAVEVRTEANGLVLPGPADLHAENRVQFITRVSGLDTQAESVPEAVLGSGGVTVFEPMHAVTLNAAHNCMEFYTWSDDDCCLPGGSVEATLLYEVGTSLEVGDFLMFEQRVTRSENGELPVEQANDRTMRHVVRLETVEYLVDPLNDTDVVNITWHAEDALPFPFRISPVITIEGDGSEWRTMIVARGNIVLADHGRSIRHQSLIPGSVESTGNYRPRLRDADLTFSVPIDTSTVSVLSSAHATSYDLRLTSAYRLRMQNPSEAHPAVLLTTTTESWIARQDLLQSQASDFHFVVEVERDGTARLRFGDDVNGNRPDPGTLFNGYYRVGNGAPGNIGAEALAHIVIPSGILPLNGVLSIRNPLAALGGTNPESMEEVRQFAPQAFRTQERAVTADDYATMTERHYDVQKASASFRWTGSWYTVFIAVDRKGGREVDDPFKEEIYSLLERYRLAGFDVEIEPAEFIPLDIAMNICVKPGFFRSNVKQALLALFSNRGLGDGTRGVFHPDNFTFEQPLYLSALIAKATGVAGVASVTVTKFQRWGKAAGSELEDAVLTPGRNQIIRLDNDRNFPENGKIEFIMEGGL